MPWNQESPMDQRVRLIGEWLSGDTPRASLLAGTTSAAPRSTNGYRDILRAVLKRCPMPRGALTTALTRQVTSCWPALLR